MEPGYKLRILTSSLVLSSPHLLWDLVSPYVMKKSNQMASEGPLNSDILRAGFHGFSFSDPLSLLFQFLDLLGLDLTPEANHGEVPDQPQGGSGVQSAPSSEMTAQPRASSWRSFLHTVRVMGKWFSLGSKPHACSASLHFPNSGRCTERSHTPSLHLRTSSSTKTSPS